MKSIKLNILISFSIILLFQSCVSKSEYEELKEEEIALVNKVQELEVAKHNLMIDNDRLKNETIELKNELSNSENKYQLLIDKRTANENKKRSSENAKKYYTEDQADQYLKDYYEFYKRDWVYQRPQFRRTDDNKFVISLEEDGKAFNSLRPMWQSRVYELVINANGTYDLSPYY